MEDDPKLVSIPVPQLASDIAIDDDPCTLGIYLEVPTHSRRRRSYQYSITSDANSESSLPVSPSGVSEEYVPDEELFDSPRLFTEMVTFSEADLKQKLWKEAARWVRFEEDVEEGGQRWSKPRVSTLSLHSFFELRSFLLNGTIVLDVPGSSVEEIFKNVLPNISGKRKLTPEKIQQIQDTLRCKCVHLFEIMKNKEVLKNTPMKSSKNKKDKTEIKMEERGPLNNGDDDNENFKSNRQFLKKLPEGAEAANVLIGEVYYLEKPICAFLRLKEKTNLGSLTEVSVASKFIFLLLGPMGQLPRYIEIGRSIATLLSDEVFREVAYKGKSKTHMLAGMDEFLDASTLLPPGEWDPTIRIEPPQEVPTKESRNKNKDVVEIDEEEEENRLREEAGLIRTGVIFGGLRNDLKRKLPWFVSDFKDALSMQSLATFFFLYFACLTPIVTFGGLLGEATGNNIAVMESLVAGLICGVAYGFFSGQPLTILGSTGPVLVFESIVYDFCDIQKWDYLSFRMWIGLWAALILVILVLVDASALVCYITRFTEENFATLIALIFIYKAVEKVIKIGSKYPLETDVDTEKFCNCSLYDGYDNVTETDLTYKECKSMNGTVVNEDCYKYYPDVFLLSIILFCGTFFISITLKNFKTASFFPTKVRNFISDFSVIIAILIMTLIDMQVGIHTPKLLVPAELKPTSDKRGWVILPFNGNPWWTALLAFVPALLACILIFMDQQITAVIINRKENKLKKGGGYHLDLFVLSILIAINSVMGLPWFVAATVLSINHVNSLKLESECAAPGEKPQFLGVGENRLTHVLIFLFIGLSVFMTPILSKIPMSVLFGVFMYMGIAALKGIQFFDRILLMFMPVKYQPDHTFLRKVPLKRVHMYTCIQLTCLVVLWVIKSFKQTSILFPLMLVVMVGVRKMLDCVFTQVELKTLDDALPEFSRMKKMEEEEDDDDSDEDDKGDGPKRERLMSISLQNGGVIKSPSYASMNISDEVNKTGLWSAIDNNIKPHGSAANSRRGSEVSRQRRRSSILEPIFANHNYQLSYEGETSLKVPGDIEVCHLSRRGSKKDSINNDEVIALTDEEQN